MREVLDLLADHLAAAWRRRWYGLVLAWLTCVAGWFTVAYLPENFTSTARLMVNTDSLLRTLMRGVAAEPDLSPQAALQAKIQQLRESVLSRPNLEQILDHSGLAPPEATVTQRARLAARLHADLVVRFGRDNVVTVSYAHPDPKVAHAVVLALVEVVQGVRVGGNAGDLERTQEFLDEQIREVEQTRRQAEEQLARFEAENRPFLPGPGSYRDQRDRLRQELAQAEAALGEATHLREELSRQLSAAGRGQAAAGAKAARLAKLEQTLAELRTRYTEQHPEVILTQRLLDRERTNPAGAGDEAVGAAAPDEQLRLQVAQAAARISTLQQRIAQAKVEEADLTRRLDQNPSIEVEHGRLKRELAVIQRNHDALIDRRERARFAQQLDSRAEPFQVSVVEPPSLPVAPEGPGRPVLLAGVLVGGVATGAGLSLLLGLLAGTFSRPARLEQVFGRPVIGTIARVTTPRQRWGRALELAGFTVVLAALLAAFGGVLTGGSALSGAADAMQRLI